MLKIKPLQSGYVLTALLIGVAVLGAATPGESLGGQESQIKRGFDIAPVPLDLRQKNRNLVGLGSYLVNSAAGCVGCHTTPQFAPGGDPFQGQPEQINTENYLAGGTPFGPFLPVPNITPDENGLPSSHTLTDFIDIMRTGFTHHHPGLQQILPWPEYRNMTDTDLRAIYEYLKAVPHAEPAGRTSTYDLMAKITDFKGYAGSGPPPIPKPAEPVQPNIVTVQDGVPVRYPGCDGLGVRIVHPVNPNAPAKNLGLVLFYVPPHVVLEPGSHWTEECYVILKGCGTMTLAGEKVEVRAGQFIHLPPWCEHGIENTGEETLEILICTSPPNP